MVPEWEARLNDFLELKQNWDSYGAYPITTQAVNSAKIMVNTLLEMGFPEPGIIPIATGGVALEWHKGDKEVAIEINDHGNLQEVFIYGDHLTSFELEYMRG